MVKPGQKVAIQKNDQQLRLLHPLDYHYYDTLRSNWLGIQTSGINHAYNFAHRKFAIVHKQLDLDFTQGMTAFTGETGAGKSIMIDALLLALGGRADASVVFVQVRKNVISVRVFISRSNPNQHYGF